MAESQGVKTPTGFENVPTETLHGLLMSTGAGWLRIIDEVAAGADPDAITGKGGSLRAAFGVSNMLLDQINAELSRRT